MVSQNQKESQFIKTFYFQVKKLGDYAALTHEFIEKGLPSFLRPLFGQK